MERTTQDDRPVAKPLPSAGEIASLPPDGGEEFNRLIHESSPYLLQHARNPVDWYPWGDEAFEKARREDKPVFLSIGYSTCHWCHVMERESFENDEIAGILNRDYVSIKVDREERPDVDNIYMAAVQAVTGSGGWPMSVFLTVDREPFLVGTYFPPEDRFGRPGFRSVLQQVTESWKGSRGNLLEGATRLTEHLRERRGSSEAGTELGEATLHRAFEQFSSQFDRSYGGFGNAPKFPRSHTLSLLLRYADRAHEGAALGMVLGTLDAMARGGIRDHLGGGFHRYSTDRYWLVPHFEKMLYDQALLVRSYVEAYQTTGRESYAHIARETLDYVLRDLRDPRGGFHSAEDADSEGEEGKFYVWTRAEILEHLGTEEGNLFARAYGVTEDGNFREEASGLLTGANILHVPRSLEDVAREESMEPEELENRLEPARKKLFTIRERRIRPHKDDKVLADWNGLMISALAHASRVLAEPTYLDAAREAARFILAEMRRDGRLLHVYRDGKASVLAYLDDHAFLSLAFLDLYEADLDPAWLEASVGLAKEMNRLFWDDRGGGFLFSGSDGERLLAQTKEVYDGAVPSGNSVAAYALLRLGRLTGDAALEEKGRKTLEAFSAQVGKIPVGHPFFLMALDFAVGPTQEIVLAGSAEDPTLLSMRRAIDARFLPRHVLLHHPTGASAARIEALAPFVREQVAREGKPTAYVCENHACKAPVTTVAELEALLGEGAQ